MKITLVTVGKIKERFWEEAIAEYKNALAVIVSWRLSR